MITNLSNLEPKNVWHYFYQITQIPRPSKHEEKIIAYLKNFAKSKKLEYAEDKVNNIVIKIPATEGMENVPGIVLQSHVDMVCEKNKGTEHDFLNDPLKLEIEGDWIKAKGTTLGADNGIGMAVALAIVDDDFEHGPIELLFTVDEETGLTGASNIDKNMLRGKFMINLDTEEDGIFYIGCAGGMDTVGVFSIEYETVNSEYEAYNLYVGGLRGGHSGMEIGERRGNAIKIIGYLLDSLIEYDTKIVSLSGGSKRNAIPREAEAILLISKNVLTDINKIIYKYLVEVKNEIGENSKDLVIKLEKLNGKYTSAFTSAFARKLINTIIAMPHGVIEMSEKIDNLVETSTNLATVVPDGNELRIETSQRSSIESAKKKIGRTVKSTFELAGARVEVRDSYPAWQPNFNSELLKIASDVYEKNFYEKPKIKVVHAGLECGILGEKYPELDMISVGPTITGAHSPDEKLKISDVPKFYNLVKLIITEIAKREQ
ncbi:aminoacyl-histidine dipeptidase [Melioribacter sp. OK-6-Me]|uniref:aminoacyl-histidine dipeptidase n=1 Tax=unclassified Melioribacter TaxID=2627329 RepID=UPI003EDA33F5